MPRSLLALVLFAACASPGPADRTAPALSVTSPERGAISGAGTVEVTGSVSDEGGIAGVAVNGVEAELDGEQFRAEIALAPGTNRIETIATDRSGNQTIDVRGALRGTFAEPGAVAGALAMRLGPGGLAAIGDTAAASLAAADLSSQLAAANPVLDTGGSCLGARADVTSVDLGPVDVDLASAGGQLQLAAAVRDVAVGLHIDFDLACIGGRRDVVATADRLDVAVALEVGVAGSRLVVDTTRAEVSLAGVDLGLGGVPTAIIDLVAGDLDAEISVALTEVLAAELEPAIERALGELTGERTVRVLGRDLELAIRPTAIDLDGGALALEATSEVRDPRASTTGYVATPSAAPALGGELAVSVADDALNQALGALWAGGALARDVELVGESGADLGGGIADTLAIDALLPPAVSFSGGGTRIDIADLIVTLGREGEPVSELALAARIDLDIAGEAGQLRLRAGEPDVALQLLGDGDGFLTERDLDILAALLATTLRGDLDALLGEIPLPAAGGAELSISSRGDGGYLTLDVTLGGT